MRLLTASVPLVLGLLAAQAPVDVAEFPPLWLDAPQIEIFLREAKVTERRPIGSGITKPDKVTLELGGVVRNAIFKNPERPTDDWHYEVGAYELDKLLGIGHVPPTVERSLNGVKGCLQLWVEGMTLASRNEPPPDLQAWREQVSVMWLFDDLVGNVDRHLNNGLMTPTYGLAFIDNSRAFTDKAVLLNDLNKRATGTQAKYWFENLAQARPRFAVTYPARILERLRTVTEKEIHQTLRSYVLPPRRFALLDRRKQILRRLDAMQRGSGN